MIEFYKTTPFLNVYTHYNTESNLIHLPEAKELAYEYQRNLYSGRLSEQGYLMFLPCLVCFENTSGLFHSCLQRHM